MRRRYILIGALVGLLPGSAVAQNESAPDKANAPAASQPAASQPAASQPANVTSQPPKAQPPAKEPSANEPPVENPPVEKPPVEKPPVKKPTVKTPAKKPAAPKANLLSLNNFRLGSYGRITAATDAHGGTPGTNNVVNFGPRLDETTYLELDLYYRMQMGGVQLQTLTTVAFKNDLFHFTGDFASSFALRNAFLSAKGVFADEITLWAGSRFYRGDTIYLLDYWPLDDLNTVGAGIQYQTPSVLLKMHLGVNRLANDFQQQEVEVPGLNNTSEKVLTLNRQRFLLSLKGGYQWGGKGKALGIKLLGYMEVHGIGEGTLNKHLNPAQQIQLPDDYGLLVGAQLGLWNFAQRASHLNLWVRYARGLAAYDELAVPTGLDLERRSWDAQHFVLALSGAYEVNRLGIMAAGYVSYFEDADGISLDYDDGWQYVIAVRPQWHLFRYFVQAAELSLQGTMPAGLDPRSGTSQQPMVFKASLLPTVVFDRGVFDRPQMRFVYTMSLLNQGARLQYNPIDPRSTRSVQHYFGIQVEWWYQSSTQYQ